MKKNSQKSRLSSQFGKLSLAVSATMFATATTASDLEIYKNAEATGAVITMILDNSTSMNPSSSIPPDYPGRTFKSNAAGSVFVYQDTRQIVVKRDDGTDGERLSYITFSFEDRDNTTRYYDRMSRLKMALIPIFADPKTYLGDKYPNYSVGLGSFGRYNNGRITSPAMPLTYDNRVALLRSIIALASETNTPIANTYAEAGAYMLGTATTGNVPSFNIRSSIDLRRKNPSNATIQQFTSSDSVISQNKYISPIQSDSQCMGNGIYFLTDGEPNGGEAFGDWQMETVRQAAIGQTREGYPIVTYDFWSNGTKFVDFKQKQENGYWTITQYLIKNALGNIPYDRTNYEFAKLVGGNVVAPNVDTLISPLKDGTIIYPPFGTPTAPHMVFERPSDKMMLTAAFIYRKAVSTIQGWEDIGYFAKHLRIPEKNPKGVSIKTATVGFGKDFSAAKGATSCDVITEAHAKNLCLWGQKGEGYGEGGFTYAEEPKDISDSLVKFIQEQGATALPAVSTGTMSVPLDAINAQKSRGFAYLPALDPKPGQIDLWNGNLKKYYTYNSTVVDGSTQITKGTITTVGKTVFKADGSGEFESNTYDIWNNLKTADGGQPQVGGAFFNVLNNADIQTPAQDTRNLFVNTGNSLTSVKVENQRAKGFTAVKQSLNLADPNAPMGNVLNFLGYPTQIGNLVDNTPIVGTFNKDLKKIGGVLHSLPQIVTHEISLTDEGEFDIDTRKDSILYGSMDGAVHFLDDKTGKEWFTFIPKEILELQPKALSGGQANGITGSLVKSGTSVYEENNIPHGVDAPWHIYNNYSLTKNGKITQYKALQSFASGGLRMGGSSYYSLDISDKVAPKQIYSLGSTYAHNLQNSATAIQGMKNGTLGTTGDQEAFARMGQSWGKPAIGFVKSGDKKVMVHFLPGGYDICYEKPTFKLNDATNTDAKCQNKANAQGNAVYMVRVGEEEVDDTTKALKIKTDSNSGKLLWWATAGASTNPGETQRSSNLQKSVHPELNHSIVTEIRTVDRNYDGLTDHIYFADLGGRVWRADINNNTTTEDFKIDRVVKLLDVSNQASGTDAPPRFYERPLFTVTNQVEQGGDLSGVITVGTGNRSAPVSEKRSTADAIYTIIDKDVGRRDLFCYTDTGCSVGLKTQNLTVANLDELTFSNTDANIKINMRRASTEANYKQGWYFPLKTWVNRAGTAEAVSGLKMFNEPDAQAGLLFTTAFNPNLSTSGNACSAGVHGETQRTLMCLPFGNCANNKEGADFTKRSVAHAGIGIVDNILTQSSPWDDGSTDGGSLFGTLCTSGECNKIEYDPNTPDPDIDSVGVDLSRLINPRDWWEK